MNKLDSLDFDLSIWFFFEDKYGYINVDSINTVRFKVLKSQWSPDIGGTYPSFWLLSINLTDAITSVSRTEQATVYHWLRTCPANTDSCPAYVSIFKKATSTPRNRKKETWRVTLAQFPQLLLHSKRERLRTIHYFLSKMSRLSLVRFSHFFWNSN